MKFESSLEEGMSYIGRVAAVRQSYFIFEAKELFMVFSLSATKMHAGNFNLVSRKSVEYVYGRFAGQGSVSSNLIVEKAKRTKHVANTLSVLNILYVLVAQGKAQVQSVGSHSKMLFKVVRLKQKKR